MRRSHAALVLAACVSLPAVARAQSPAPAAPKAAPTAPPPVPSAPKPLPSGPKPAPSASTTASDSGAAPATPAPAACPPGAYCEAVDVPPLEAEADAAEGDREDLEGSEAEGEWPAPPEAPGAPGTRRVRAVRSDGSETVIVLGDDEQLVVVNQRRAAPPAKRRSKRWREHVGLSLRLEGAGYESPFGDARADLGGLGASFRWRPLPHFALDVGADLFRGTGFRGENRAEVEGALTALLFINPQHRVQVYGLAGFHGAHAELGAPLDDAWMRAPWATSASRDYLGVHGGIGVEVRVSRFVGLALDLVGVARTKVDDSPAEFVDPASDWTSNVHGGGRLRGAVNFWW
jgi:hypothetical protein